MIDLTLVRAVIACEKSLSLDRLEWCLWRHGIICRQVELPEQWWQSPTDIEAGVWITNDSTDPPTWWIVRHSAGCTRVQPLRAENSPSPCLESLELKVLSLWPALSSNASHPWGELKRNLKLAKWLRQGMAAALVRAGVWLLLPFLAAQMLLKQIPADTALVIATLSLLVGLLLDNHWQRIWLNRSEGQRIAFGLNGMQRVLRLSLPLLRKFRGQGAVEFVAALQEIGQTLPLLLGNSLQAFGLLGSASLVLLLWQPGLGLTSVVACLIWILASALLLISGRSSRLNQKERQAQATLRSQQLIEASSNLRLAGAEERALAWWQDSAASAQHIQQRIDWIDTCTTWLAVGASAVSVLTALQVQESHSLVAGLILVGMQLGGAGVICKQLKQLEQLESNWEAARLLFACPSEWRRAGENPGELRGDLTVDNLSFRYGTEQPLVLDQVSFNTAPGSFVAVVGPSGSGKSTLVKLILGLETPLHGRLLFDGRDATTLEHHLLRPQIGTVLQNARLVGSTLFDVIASGRSITTEQAWAAAEQACLAEDLRALPMGLQTLVLAGGKNLSGGQRQRLAIARALAGQPRLLLFDEPTSALDNRSQQHVLKSLEQLAITRLLVAHRLSTVRNADLILVLDQGMLVQMGNYEQLVSQEGLFSDLMQRQKL